MTNRFTLFGEEEAPAVAMEAGQDAGAGTRDSAPKSAPDGEEKETAPQGTAPTPETEGEGGEKENAAWQQAQRQAEKVRQTVANWLREQENVQRDYPGFSLEEALKEPDFARLVRAGVSMRRAYEAVHLPEILYDAMRRAAREGESRAAEMIRQRGRRPAENGLSPTGGAPVKKSAQELTRKERQSLIKRLQRGEKVAL